MAAGGAVPTAEVRIEMEPAPAKETNSPSPKQLLVLLALTSFGLSIVVGGVAITFDGLSAEDRSGAGGFYILSSANATAFALIHVSHHVSQRVVLKARSTPQP